VLARICVSWNDLASRSVVPSHALGVAPAMIWSSIIRMRW
jgi:hypothetical protein